jgi:hypothetical protein
MNNINFYINYFSAQLLRTEATTIIIPFEQIFESNWIWNWIQGGARHHLSMVKLLNREDEYGSANTGYYVHLTAWLEFSFHNSGTDHITDKGTYYAKYWKLYEICLRKQIPGKNCYEIDTKIFIKTSRLSNSTIILYECFEQDKNKNDFDVNNASDDPDTNKNLLEIIEKVLKSYSSTLPERMLQDLEKLVEDYTRYDMTRGSDSTFKNSEEFQFNLKNDSLLKHYSDIIPQAFYLKKELFYYASLSIQPSTLKTGGKFKRFGLLFSWREWAKKASDFGYDRYEFNVIRICDSHLECPSILLFHNVDAASNAYFDKQVMELIYKTFFYDSDCILLNADEFISAWIRSRLPPKYGNRFEYDSAVIQTDIYCYPITDNRVCFRNDTQKSNSFSAKISLY